MLRSAFRAVRGLRIFVDRRKRADLLAIAADNGWGPALRYMFSNELRLRRVISLVVGDTRIHLRTCSPDLLVARSSLMGEFDAVSQTFPHDQDGLIIDAGGYIGTSALAFARMYPNATIVVVEPSSDNLAVLRKNVAGKPRIHVEHAAMMPAPATGTITLKNRGTGDWGFTIVPDPKDRAATAIEQVPGICVEQILEKYGYPEVMILKMDIEGGEYELLRQPGWLARTRALFIELHERIVPGINEAFEAANAGRMVSRTDGEKLISLSTESSQDRTKSTRGFRS